MNTQKENVKAVVEKGGDYCVALKGNQGNFYTDMQDYFDKDTGEKRYYISSLLRDIATFSEAIRGHWEVENKLHWQMDFTF